MSDPETDHSFDRPLDDSSSNHSAASEVLQHDEIIRPPSPVRGNSTLEYLGVNGIVNPRMNYRAALTMNIAYACDESSNSSEDTLLVPVPPQTSRMVTNTRSPEYWSIPKHLFNREIGNYCNNAKWSKTIYGSEVIVKKFALSKRLRGHYGSVNTLNFSKNGSILVSGSVDNKICLWDWTRGNLEYRISGLHSRGILQTKFLLDKSAINIVSCSCDGKVVLCTLSNADTLFSRVLACHHRSCGKFALHNDLPHIILSCGHDGIVKNIDIRESSTMNPYQTNSDILHVKHPDGRTLRLYGIDINPMNPNEFIVNGDDKYIRMYDKRNLSSMPIKTIGYVPMIKRVQNDNYYEDDDNHSDPRLRQLNHVSSAIYNHCGTEILASYFHDDIYLFDVNGPPNNYLHIYHSVLNKNADKVINFYGHDSNYVASGSRYGCMFMWNKTSEALVLAKHADENGVVNAIETHPRIPVLATCGKNETIKIWEPLNQCEEPNLPNMPSFDSDQELFKFSQPMRTFF